jgi:hypothetical protein
VANTNAVIPWSVGHPGTLESLIPLWGSGREAIADFQEGDYLGAAINGGLAASDIFLFKALANMAFKGGLKIGGSHTWNATRKWMAKNGYFLEPGQVGHHWLIPQGGWGKNVPTWLKNQPWNIKVLPNQARHISVHGQGKNKYNALQQFWYGTPARAKAAVISTGGHGAEAEELEE